MTEARYDPLKIEPEIQRFWEKKKIYDKVRKKNAKGKPFYFLDGPPYPTGYTHPGTAANKVAKDLLMRYKRCAGFDVRDRPGWDMHGLPIEHKAEKKLGLKTKKDIIKFGEDKFIEECKKFAFEHMGIMEKDFNRLGIWMPWKEAYLTLNPTYMESVWYGIKCAHDRGLVYKGKKVLHWCPRCATSLAKNELIYKTVEEPSVYVKFKVKDKPNEYLIIWTTTPWTLPFNMAVMAHPDFDYVKIQVDNEKWILAKGLVNSFMGAVVGKKYKILEMFKGQKLEGLEYEQPFTKEMPYHKEKKKAYFVVLSTEFVSLTAGSGLVHCAPGCGPEDYLIGTKHKIPIFNELDEHGYFAGESGKFIGLKAKEDDKKFVDILKEKGLLIAEVLVEHEYAFCWRCVSPIIYRATEQWFMAISKIRDKILQNIKKLYIVPEYAKKIFLDWISGFQDWCITIQRFWNIPFPVWVCNKCDNYEVIGTILELEKKSKKKVKNLHKPVVDKLSWACKCGGKVKRVPDVISVWFDSGASSWASLDYPSNKALYKKFFPADFILEGRDQIRAWFSALMNFSMAAFDKPPYKALYWHGFFNDEQGITMSKSKGNFIPVMDMINKVGADPLRIKFLKWCMPGADIRFNWKELTDSFKAINVLWNTYQLILKRCEHAKFNPAKYKLDQSKLNAADKWILSKTNSLIKDVTDKLNKYYICEVSELLKDFWLEALSRGYIHLTRDRIAAQDKTTLAVLYTSFFELLKLTSPVIPFVAEAIYQEFRSAFKLKEESVHLLAWPSVNKKLINKNLEQEMDIVRGVASTILAIREKINRNVRWPVKVVYVITEDEKISKATAKHNLLIKNLTNSLDIRTESAIAGLKHKIKVDFKKIGPKYGAEAAEVVRRVAEQSPESIMRKLKKDKKIVFKLASGKKAEIVRDELMIEEILPKGLAGLQVNSYSIYLDLEETSEMLAAGFARETLRAIQSLRKKAGLEKPDNISLALNVSGKLADMLRAHVKELKERAGVEVIKFGKSADVVAKRWHDRIKVRDKEIAFGFDVF